MKNFERKLKSELNKEVKEGLDKILEGGRDGFMKRRRGSFKPLLAAACTLAICAACTTAFLKPGIFKHNGDSDPVIVEPTVQPGKDNNITEPGGTQGDVKGGLSGDLYPLKSVTSAVKLPDGIELASYTYGTDEAMGKKLLATLERLVDYDFPDSLNVSNVHYESQQNQVNLWGQLDGGLFSYQHIRSYEEQFAVKDSEETRKKAKQKALQIAEELSPFVGELKLHEEKVETLDDGKGNAGTRYWYGFYPVFSRTTTDGYPIRNTITMYISTDGFVEYLCSNCSKMELIETKIEKYPHSIIDTFEKNFGMCEVENSEVVITSYDIYYMSTPGIEGISECHPTIIVKYTLNGEAKDDILILPDNF